ncbi:Hypothetical protein FKW44_018884 [Caligus rogercresseyi]|uniref:RNase H type-1 domain-containing protein n=1 Tax=Caligus rogercresseyi TaxID=217165 RepID=A0A7T8JYD5_CALRO|nr:Hypothetical protein FKW44_018884 [Caligus rogercresseyi]
MIPISLSWVKGHSDITVNEVADMLAKRGAENVYPTHDIGAPNITFQEGCFQLL